MEKKDLDLEKKRLKTAQRRENENETVKKLRQESDRQRIAKKRQLIADAKPADLNLEIKRLKAAEERRAICLELNLQQTAVERATASPEKTLIRLVPEVNSVY